MIDLLSNLFDVALNLCKCTVLLNQQFIRCTYMNDLYASVWVVYKTTRVHMYCMYKVIYKYAHVVTS